MKPKQSRQWFARPEDEARVGEAWERFLGGGPASVPRGLVGESWKRCLSDHVDPLLARAARPLGEESLARLAERHARLVAVGTPLIAQAREFLAETGTVMLLTDPQGTILSVEGDPRIREPLGEVRLVAGARWNEADCGTNAIGTALSLGQPVQIHAAEHFCAGIKHWTCSAALIRDPIDSAIMGVVDVSGLSGSFSRHSLALAITTSQRIEAQLARLEMEHRFRLLERTLGRLSPGAAGGVLVYDAHGRLVKASGEIDRSLAELGVRTPAAAIGTLPALATTKPGEAPRGLPSWLQAAWIEPVADGGELLGHVVNLPRPRTVAPRVPDRPGGPDPDAAFARLAASGRGLAEALAQARQLAGARVPVLLLGETGVGKELFARAIHAASPNSGGRFVALNCGGLPRDLLTSELFGYGEGAFTGARRGGMIGKLEAASGGTLFLDEIGEMPLDLQPQLLRVLEEREFYRIGENTPRKAAFRLLAATHRDLRSEVDAGRFRIDLYYRIAVTTIRIPPLRERRDDLPALVHELLDAVAQRHGMEAGPLEPDALAALVAHGWPGNIRELRNAVEAAALMACGKLITRAHLPADIRSAGASPRQPQASGSLVEAEQAQIRAAIASCHGNLSRAACELGISKSTLYLKLKRYGIRNDVRRARAAQRASVA